MAGEARRPPMPTSTLHLHPPPPPQAAFYHAINENTPGPTARSVAATPGEAPLMAALGEADSPEDASLQLALRLQQAREPSPL